MMASCVRNICAKNYQNLIIGFQVTVENVWDVFVESQCILVLYVCMVWLGFSGRWGQSLGYGEWCPPHY